MHRVVFELTHGYCPDKVDHEDTNRLNNTPSNLRPATHSTNCHNANRRVDNSTGVKGLSWHKAKNNWVGQIALNGERYKKASADRSVVEAWLITKRKELHGDFANNG